MGHGRPCFRLGRVPEQMWMLPSCKELAAASRVPGSQSKRTEVQGNGTTTAVVLMSTCVHMCCLVVPLYKAEEGMYLTSN